MSNVVLEAMAAGIPVVATNIPGTRDLVVPNETGYLVTVGERADFARWANQLLDDPELARRLGSAGRARAAERFSAHAMIDRFAALYRELLDSKRGSGR
jgi:glycosyltransferase involved in cell wall biosynthesis